MGKVKKSSEKVTWGKSAREQQYNSTRIAFGDSKSKDARIIPENGVFEGTVLSINELKEYSTKDKPYLVYNLKELGETGDKTCSMTLSTDLASQFKTLDVKVGSTVQITYIGKYTTKKNHRKVKRFNVRKAEE